MSGYDGVVGGKLKLKGKALDITGGVKKKKKNKRQQELITQVTENELSEDVNAGGESGNGDEGMNDGERSSAERKAAANDDNLTPAEKRYIEQRAQIDVKRMAKEANKSHRDRIQDFNQNLANMSEHYDIPKVGPG